MKNGVKKIQTAGYNGACTVIGINGSTYLEVHCSVIITPMILGDAINKEINNFEKKYLSHELLKFCFSVARGGLSSVGFSL